MMGMEIVRTSKRRPQRFRRLKNGPHEMRRDPTSQILKPPNF